MSLHRWLESRFLLKFRDFVRFERSRAIGIVRRGLDERGSRFSTPDFIALLDGQLPQDEVSASPSWLVEELGRLALAAALDVVLCRNSAHHHDLPVLTGPGLELVYPDPSRMAQTCVWGRFAQLATRRSARAPPDRTNQGPGLSTVSPAEVFPPDPVRVTHFRVSRYRTLFRESTGCSP